jgi:cysteine desulfurase
MATYADDTESGRLIRMITSIPKKEGYVYLDYQATTPCDPRVVEAALPYLTEHFGNPHSRNHIYGWEAEAAVEKAREQIATLIGANPTEIIFTSGATESNNLAIKGAAQFYKSKGKNHIITCITEHKCVLDACRHLEQDGFEVTYLPVQQDGLVDLNVLKAAIKPNTVLVSIMAVNNEIGVIQPLADIGKICRDHGVFFHTDAAQAVGKIPLDMEAMNIDMLSISGHKLYAPKGVGALFVRKRPRVRLAAQINGGGQERGMRSGTLSPFLCVALGTACEIARNEMEFETARITRLNNFFWKKLSDALPEIYLNGHASHRIPGNLNISFAYVEGEGLMMGIKNLCLSSGSACTSASLEPSYVLYALGVEDEMAHTSLRIGIGRFTTEDELEIAANSIISSVNRLRDMSPLYEMVRSGIDLKSIKWTEH